MVENLRKITWSGFRWILVVPLNWAQNPKISVFRPDSVRPAIYKSGISELNNGQTGNALEMARIDG